MNIFNQLWGFQVFRQLVILILNRPSFVNQKPMVINPWEISISEKKRFIGQELLFSSFLRSKLSKLSRNFFLASFHRIHTKQYMLEVYFHRRIIEKH